MKNSLHELTHVPDEWTPFDGDYKKCIQDIKLKDGRIFEKCWPNAGKFMVLSDDRQPSIPVSEVAEVKKNHSLD